MRAPTPIFFKSDRPTEKELLIGIAVAVNEDEPFKEGFQLQIAEPLLLNNLIQPGITLPFE